MTLAEIVGPAVSLPSRVERKFVLPEVRTRAAAAWLRHACRPAREFASGSVTSCYFDAPELAAYFGSADGAWQKAKVRLRWYDDWSVEASPGQTSTTGFRSFNLPVFLELKGRTGVESWKRRLPLALPREALSEALACTARSCSAARP